MNKDIAIENAKTIICKSRGEAKKQPIVKSFFDEDTFTISHIVIDPQTKSCAIIDSVLNFDQISGRTGMNSVNMIAAYIEQNEFNVEWLMETHIHADHLSAASFLKKMLGGKIAVGEKITQVQKTFGKIFNEKKMLLSDTGQFDRLLCDGEAFNVGKLDCIALSVPGHTPACSAYVIGDSVFIGDTLFMPDYGTARCDFPGGDSSALYKSIRRLMKLPDHSRVFLCHDYKAEGRDWYEWETTIGDQRKKNIHIHDGVNEKQFVEMRNARDKSLPLPKMIISSVQVNIKAGTLPEPEDNGIHYLKIPVDLF